MSREIEYCKCTTHPTKIGGKCLASIYSKKVLDYSIKTYGKPICFNCQQHQPIEEEK